MSDTGPPPETQRFRSQTPESPRPVHVPKPAEIPVLENQMDPVFNDTTTYNIPANQTFSPFAEPVAEQVISTVGVEEQDAVQSFFREAEQAAAEPTDVETNNSVPDLMHTQAQASSLPSVPSTSEHESSAPHSTPAVRSVEQTHVQGIGNEASAAPITSTATGNTVQGASAETQHPPASEEKRDSTVTATAAATDAQPNPYGSGNEGGVDYQSLLDNIAQSSSSAPAADNVMASDNIAAIAEETLPTFLSVPGLPKKPPPQDNPVEFPPYPYTQNNQAREDVPAVTDLSSSLPYQHDGKQVIPQASDQVKPPDLSQLLQQASALNGGAGLDADQLAQAYVASTGMAPTQDVLDYIRGQDSGEPKWSTETQAKYDRFLEDERRYVTEGIWDRFPNGSRLFVGNLPSEKVTKRDLFHIFHRHGKLAQISIKQAYGFVQFLEAEDCTRALNAEQGVEIRGRKVHLEVSKPQKNTRGQGSNSNKGQTRRRSRSPDRANRRSNDRNYSEYRNESGRRRDSLRRSPSPRSYRTRDEPRVGSRDGTMPRSPMYGTGYPLPPAMPPVAYDDEAALPLPRRDPRVIPDVQLLVMDPETVQSFINWVENMFRAKGLSAATIWMNPRLPLPAVIKRQIIEGVQAVVKLGRDSQNRSKIPLQVFDRSGGASNVNFNEYADLDPSVAADIVLQARARERNPDPNPFRAPYPPAIQGFAPPAPYGHPSQYSPQIPQQQYPSQSQSQPTQYGFLSPQAQTQNGYRPAGPPTPNTPSTTQPPNLQQLLANLRQPNQQLSQPPATPQAGQPYGAAAQPYAQPQYGQYAGSTQGYAAAQPPTPQQNVQNIMEQLARYQR